MRDRHCTIASLKKLAGNSSVPTSNKNAGIMSLMFISQFHQFTL
jgi:hypothetical protein